MTTSRRERARVMATAAAPWAAAALAPASSATSATALRRGWSAASPAPMVSATAFHQDDRTPREPEPTRMPPLAYLSTHPRQLPSLLRGRPWVIELLQEAQLEVREPATLVEREEGAAGR